jgi:hypothetical protein
MHVFTPEEWNTTSNVPRYMQNINKKTPTFTVLPKNDFPKEKT